MYLFNILIFLVICKFCTSLHFFMGEKERKCFSEDLPYETKAIIHYMIEVFEESSNTYLTTFDTGLYVEIKDPQNKIVLSRLYSQNGRISFSSQSEGEYLICMWSNSTSWWPKHGIKVNLDIIIGNFDYRFTKIEEEKVSELQMRLKSLASQVEKINKEQEYQRTREEKFRSINETTSSFILWFAFVQLSVLGVMGLWQMKHLTKFFKTKKIV